MMHYHQIARQGLWLGLILFAFAIVPAQALAVGTCRGKNCPCNEEQLKQGMVDTDKGCLQGQGCDKKGLEKAKEERNKWFGVYKDQQAMADQLWKEALAAYQEGNDLFDKFWNDQLYKELPQPFRVYFNPGTKEEILKEAVRTLKALGKKLRDGAWSKVIKRAKLIEFIANMSFLEAKMLTKLEEGQQISEKAAKAADAAFESLHKARLAEERVRELEKNCAAEKSGGGKSTEPKSEDDDRKSSGEQDLEAAEELLKSWKEVDGGYYDAKTGFHASETALREAEQILLERQESSWGGKYLLASSTHIENLHFAQAEVVKDELTDIQAIKFGQVLARGLDDLARALEALDRVKLGLQKIERVREKRPAVAMGTGPAGQKTVVQAGSVVVSGTGQSKYSVFDAAGTKSLKDAKTNGEIELLPGSYQVSLNEISQTVNVRAGQKTVVQAGSVVVSGTGQSKYSVFDAAGTKSLKDAHTNGEIELLPGSYVVKVNDRTFNAQVRAGQRTTISP